MLRRAHLPRRALTSGATMSMRKKVLDAPAYGLTEAAHLLSLPVPTLRSWVKGRPYPTASGQRQSGAVIGPADPEGRYLSFTNLVEAHVLSAVRREHRVKFRQVRNAVEFLRQRFRSQHPLADHQFETDGVDLFVERLGGQLLNASRGGQMAVRELIEMHLRRIERNPQGVPIRLFPFTHSQPGRDARGPIVIDPELAFGRPSIRRLGVPTAIVAERYKAGDTVDGLAADYDATREEIEEALRCELPLNAA